jgi:translation initiation factor 1 (eIF-1/SUI1)
VRRGVVHLRIEKAGRAGKTVTVLFGDGLERASDAERADLLRSFKRALGVGGATGTAANPRTGAAVPTLEFQGDERARLTVLLRREGFSI